MERHEQPRQQERNLEQDRLAFLEAVKIARISGIETLFDERATDSLTAELADAKLFLLGETHGVQENPDIIYTLFRKFGCRNLALEWGSAWKHAAERFLDGEGLDFGLMQDSPDGRVTAGHFALLKKLKEEGLLERLVCFDPGSVAGWEKRDEGMARNIMEHMTAAPTLVVAGNLHTKVEPIGVEGEEDERHPMGEHVKRAIPGVPSGRIRCLTGEFHNYGTRNFGGGTGKTGSSRARFYKENGLYIFELPEAHAAVVPHPSESRTGDGA